MPVTHGVAGSSPVRTAKRHKLKFFRFVPFFFEIHTYRANNNHNPALHLYFSDQSEKLGGIKKWVRFVEKSFGQGITLFIATRWTGGKV